MERSSARLALASLLLVVLTLVAPPASAQVFCRSQFNLANEACSMRTLPGLPGMRPLMPLPRARRLVNETSTAAATMSTASAATSGGAKDGASATGEEEEDGATGGDEGDGQEQRGDEEERRPRHHRHHHRRSDVSRRMEDDPYDTACCRRLMALDNSCVCQAAGRARLPYFMTSVRHVVTLTPIAGCAVSFECPGTVS